MLLLLLSCNVKKMRDTNNEKIESKQLVEQSRFKKTNKKQSTSDKISYSVHHLLLNHFTSLFNQKCLLGLQPTLHRWLTMVTMTTTMITLITTFNDRKWKKWSTPAPMHLLPVLHHQAAVLGGEGVQPTSGTRVPSLPLLTSGTGEVALIVVEVAVPL